jgi:hypothetical protein
MLAPRAPKVRHVGWPEPTGQCWAQRRPGGGGHGLPWVDRLRRGRLQPVSDRNRGLRPKKRVPGTENNPRVVKGALPAERRPEGI